MENKLNEELLRQLLLMNFDRGKTLSEQKVIPSDRLGPQGDLQPNIKLQIPAFLKTEKENYNDDKQVAISAYNKIVYEIDGGWAPWKWGTDEQGMSDAILSIKNLQQYQILRELLGKKYPLYLKSNPYDYCSINNEINQMLRSDKLLRRAHLYLKNLDKQNFYISKFLKDLKKLITTF